MSGRHSGAVTQKAEGTLPSFYRMRYAAHQIDHVIQDVISGSCDETFYGTLTLCISQLRREQNLVSAVKTTCPKVAPTRWLSLAGVSNWVSKHCDALISQFEVMRLFLRLYQGGGYCYCPSRPSGGQLTYVLKACKARRLCIWAVCDA